VGATTKPVVLDPLSDNSSLEIEKTFALHHVRDSHSPRELATDCQRFIDCCCVDTRCDLV
jgi:hypothetical protein